MSSAIYDPVAKKKIRKVGSDAHTSIAEGAAEISSTSTSGKPSIGKTGVHLHWCKPNEFAKLSKNQKREFLNGGNPGTTRQDRPTRGKDLVIRTHVKKRQNL